MVISKLTHQVWFQGWENLPEKYHEDVYKLEILNQNWEHKKWDEESLRAECEKFSQLALAKFDGFTNMIQKVDFGRYVVLYNHGGVSVDCDAECIRSLDKTPGIDRYDIILSKNPLTNLENKITTFGFSKNMVILNNATICCAREHPLMKQFIEFLIENESWNEDLFLDTQLKTGPLVTSIFFNKFLDDIHIVDSDIFEPFGNVNRRTVLNHKYDQSWTGYGASPIKVYRVLKNNLVFIIAIVAVVVAFFILRKILEKSLG
jgi:mannosyltransferase OCH1-like enzyme